MALKCVAHFPTNFVKKLSEIRGWKQEVPSKFGSYNPQYNLLLTYSRNLIGIQPRTALAGAKLLSD